MENNINWNCEEDGKCYIKNVLIDWAIFNECFSPTKIKISDIDGVVEHNGWFLFIEVKQYTKKIPQGQDILFKKLTEISDRITVLLLHTQGAAGNLDIRECAMYQKGEMIRNWRPTNIERIKNVITNWFQEVRRRELREN